MDNSEGFRDNFTKLVAETTPECTEATADYWFADENDEDEKYGKSEQAIARSICKRCPIRHACLEYALTTGQQYGIWGGLLPAQRHAYLNQMNRQQGRL